MTEELLIVRTIRQLGNVSHKNLNKQILQSMNECATSPLPRRRSNTSVTTRLQDNKNNSEKTPRAQPRPRPKQEDARLCQCSITPPPKNVPAPFSFVHERYRITVLFRSQASPRRPTGTRVRQRPAPCLCVLFHSPRTPATSNSTS